jgi:P-type Ca2+ transporter type 2C
METGLTTQQIQERFARYGKNSINAHTTTSGMKLLLSQFTTVINAILAIAGIISFALNHILDGSFIFTIIIINALFGFIQEYRAEKSLEKLKEYASPTARVIRNGKEKEILAEELVPEDIVLLFEGTRVPADGILTNVINLEIEEAILTGESLSVIKKNNDEAFLGTLITKGKAQMLVTHTGMQTRFGQIADTLTSIKDEKTPLQKDFAHLGKYLSLMALFLGFLVIPAGLFYKQELIPLILVSASIAIAAIPEGLPAVIMIAFAVGTRRMAKRNAITRKMAAIETLGAIQYILVDKTGTLTQNSMRVKQTWIANEQKLPLLLRACVLGNSASLIERTDTKDFEILGDQTDGAMLLWARQHNQFETIPQGEIIDEFVFDANTKTITTLWKQDKREYVFVRGAPESIIERAILTKKERATITKHFESYAKQGYRAIAFAMKHEEHFTQKSREHLEQHLTFLGILALYDPPRPEIKDALAKAHLAGIHVIMVTGDNELTALAIAKEIGLTEKNTDVMTGKELANITEDELSSIITRVRIFARTKPEQKLRLTKALQHLGKVVGVTGDGVNDALALKKADVGVAMGAKGTDVAKESADIILADDNFATLIKAIEEGRSIYKNITNAILYLLTGNLTEVSLVFFATLLNMPFPLLPTQILWINLVTDSLPALALATGNKDASVLLKKPRDPNTRLLNNSRIMTILTIGLSMTLILLYIFFFSLQTQTEAFARTIVFNSLIYFHLAIVLFLGWHSIKKGNLMLIATIILIAIIQLLITYLPFFQELFHLAI